MCMAMETPKGMRDYLPEDMVTREDIIEKIKKIYKKYGYLPRDSPALEKLTVLNAKSGEEIKGQIFRIENDDTGLRFDLTVPLARMCSNTSFPKPFKNYCIGKVWRREEPQKGRFREFYQADVDVIGCQNVRAEAELLTIANEVLDEFKFKERKILLNNRKILNALSKNIGIENQKDKVFRELDKIDKIGKENAIEKIEQIIGKEKTKEFFSMLKLNGTNKEKLEAAKKINEEGAKELEEILQLCDFEIQIDLTLVRGLGYYTGPVYEIKLSKDIGTIIAGGRYDNLLELYGQKECAVGISIGIERLLFLLKERKKGPDSRTDVFIASVKGYYEYSIEIAGKLRSLGISCQTDLNERNLKKQFDYANSLNIPYIIIVGEKEKNENKATLRDMKTGNEEMININDIAKKIRGI